MRVVRAVLLSFAVLLHVFPDTSFEGGALLFLFSACLLVWSMCLPISIPRAEQSAYNVITIYPFSKDPKAYSNKARKLVFNLKKNEVIVIP